MTDQPTREQMEDVRLFYMANPGFWNWPTDTECHLRQLFRFAADYHNKCVAERSPEPEGTRPNYRGGDCKNCGRSRIELDGICEKCGWDNDGGNYATITRPEQQAAETMVFGEARHDPTESGQGHVENSIRRTPSRKSGSPSSASEQD